MIITNKEKKDWFLIDPDSSLKAAWEVFGLFCIIYQSILIPYRLCFEQEAVGFWIGIETAIDISFILDIFVQFNTGFYKKGNLCTNIYKLSTWCDRN